MSERHDAYEHDPRLDAIPDVHGHAKGEHKPYAEERPIPYSARMLFLWFYHACRRGSPRFMMVADHMNYLTFEDPAAVNLVRRALKLAAAGDLYGAAETAGVELAHAAVVSEGLRKGMRYSIGAEVDNDPRSRPDAQNIVDAMKPDAMIRSVHFLPITHPVHGENWPWPFDNPDFKDLFEVVGVERTWTLYMAQLLEAIEKLPGHVVGHFYAPAKFGHWPDDETLDRYEDRLIEAAAARGMAVELNARYFYRYFNDDETGRRRYRNANLRLLKKAKTHGVLIAVGSDAHSPKDQGGGFDDVLELLDAAHINEIAFPVNGRMGRVALRATEEILRQRSTPPPPPIGSSVTGFGRAELAAVTRSNGAATVGGETQDDQGEERPPGRVVAKARARALAGVKSAAKAAAEPARARSRPVKVASTKSPAAKPAVTKRSSAKAASSAKSATAKPASKPVSAKAPTRVPTPRVGAARKVTAAKKHVAAKRSAGARRLDEPAKPAPGKKRAGKKRAPARKRWGARRQRSAAKASERTTAKRIRATKKAAARGAGTKKNTLKRTALKVSATKKSAVKKPPAKKRTSKSRR